MSRKNQEVFTISFTTIAHGITIVLFNHATPGISQVPRFPPQFFLLLSISWSAAILPVLFHLHENLWSFILLRIICVQLIGIPLGESLYIDAILTTTILIDSALHLRKTANILFSSLSFLLLVFFQRPVTAWDVTQLQPQWTSTVSVFFFCFVVWQFAMHVSRLEAEASLRELTLEQMNGAITNLTRTNIGFQHYAVSVQAQSAQNERNRITREIHDTAGYTLTNLRMMMEAAIRVNRNRNLELDRILQTARDQAWHGLNDVRRALRVLRAEETPRDTVTASVYKLTRAFQEATGMEVSVVYGITSQTFGEAIDLALYRTIQEGITNAFRHGKVTRVDVHLWETASEVLLTIRDNGRSKATIKEGIGLTGMRERARNLGGEVHIDSSQLGFGLSVHLPRAFAAN